MLCRLPCHSQVGSSNAAFAARVASLEASLAAQQEAEAARQSQAATLAAAEVAEQAAEMAAKSVEVPKGSLRLTVVVPPAAMASASSAPSPPPLSSSTEIISGGGSGAAPPPSGEGAEVGGALGFPDAFSPHAPDGRKQRAGSSDSLGSVAERPKKLRCVLFMTSPAAKWGRSRESLRSWNQLLHNRQHQIVLTAHRCNHTIIHPSLTQRVHVGMWWTALCRLAGC